jgi:pimeloyl-ACP methyl ester carboxylesterase
MNIRKIRVSICVLIILALLAGCIRSTIKQSNVQLKPCSLGWIEAQCGTLRVYENRAARSGRMLDLNIVVIKAQSDDPASDPIFYLAGGPGDAATEDARRQQFPFSLSQNHDLVFVDQRGTGGSNRVLIPDDQPDLSGLSPEEMDAQAKAWIAKVLREIDMDPQFYTTSVAMDDLDEVREALGYDKINLVGYSYGATAAQYYLRQHEAHVRTMALGGSSLLDIPVFELWAHNSQRALDLIFDRCQADARCHTAFPDLREEFETLLVRLAAEPVTENFSNSSDQQSASVTFTTDFFAAVLRYMTKDAKDHAILPLLIHRAYKENDWKGFTQFVANHGGPEWWGNQIMEHVIRCSEKWAAFDPVAVAQLSEGSYLAGWDLSLAHNQALSCKYTPRGEIPEGMAPQPGSQVPVLILNGEVDPIDPPENMAGAAELWPNSLSLVAPYQGHSFSDMNAISCWFSILNEFIQSGSVDGLHTACMQNIQPPAFVVP